MTRIDPTAPSSAQLGNSQPAAPVRRSFAERYIAANVKFIASLIVMMIFLFAILRAGLIWRTWTPDAATYGQLAWSFIPGLRFDLAIACYICIPIVVCCYVPFLAPWRSERLRKIFLWVWSIVISSAMFTLLCEYEFFNEFQSRYNQLAVRYWKHPTTVGGMVWHNYPVMRYVTLGLLIGVVVHVWMRFSIRWAYGVIDGRKPINFTAEIIGVIVIISGLVIGARGGLQGEPLRWGDAFRGESEFANQMSLNGIYSLAGAVRDTFGRSATGGKWLDDEALVEDRKTVRQLLLAPGEKLIDPDNRTVLRMGDPGSTLRLTRADGKPVNVVVVMMESMSARFVGACGAKESFTPSLDAIAEDGISFDRTLSAGTHTHQGIFAIQLGFPNLPGFETLMESSVANQHFMSAAEIFQNRGYQTMFLYNGNFAWDNMRGFFQKQGVESFVGREQMQDDAEYVDEVWGVSDADVFKRANREFERMSKEGPFYATIMTLSNHAPFQVPPVPGASPVTGHGELDIRLNALRYADYAIGKFVEEAKTLSYYKDTLFVFIGDHGFHVPPALTEVHLLYHHVPLIFYAPGLTDRRGVDHRLATHMNIVPSILGLLNITDSQHASWGRSLFNDSFPDENFIVFKNSGGGRAVGIARENKLLVLGSATGRPLLMTFDLGQKPSITPLDEPETLKTMEKQLRDYVEAGVHDLTHNLAGPMEPGVDPTP